MKGQCLLSIYYVSCGIYYVQSPVTHADCVSLLGLS